ncbi:lipocalin family protein [Pontibacter sp. H259]|uniref:lipocalin family protein n=1 Tax=Pontibacter sp. H259 TaxID=3133421 RepID=UPI0030C1CBAE
MNKHLLRNFLFALLVPLFLVSCGDDDDDNGISPNVSLLTAGEWRGDAIYSDGEDVTDLILEENGFDMTLYRSKFERDGTYQDSYPNETIPEGTWKFENNERIIVFEDGTDDEYYVVVSKLDEDELSYVQSGFEFRFVR